MQPLSLIIGKFILILRYAYKIAEAYPGSGFEGSNYPQIDLLIFFNLIFCYKIKKKLYLKKLKPPEKQNPEHAPARLLYY